MPLRFRLPGARLASRGLVFGLVGLGAILAILPFLGRFLYSEDPLQRSDAILVFAGTIMERPLEAYDLYRSGYAPLIVLTRDRLDGGQKVLARRGVAIEDAADTARDVLQHLGAPSGALLVLPPPHDGTVQEARSFRDLIRDRGWHRVIVVTSKMHTRRARMALERELKGLDVQVIARGSRYDPADPAHWWRRRSDARFVLLETEKYLAYLIGMT